MAKKIFSCSLTGLKCQIVEVETDISAGLPSFSIVGLGDASVQESKERVRSSIKNSGATYPQNKKTINLAPAELKKQGSSFDLPIAAGILLESEQINPIRLQNSVIIGELSLYGEIKKINGALAITQHAKEKGFKRIFLPKENANEASFIDGIEIYPLKNLREFIGFCLGNVEILPYPYSDFQKFKERFHNGLYQYNDYSLTHIIGLDKAKRALCVAAAGGHNVLLKGPPGTGKTILARAFANLLPEMSKDEILETSKIFSISGMLDNSEPLIIKRPFREIHHTASTISVIGGIKLGEITLAHNGVLFFDEITEFPRQILEALRQPLEDRYINISRANYSERFPCNFIFLATMNPCPCGYLNDKRIKCMCSDSQIINYQKKLSGPIKDRFDIFLNIPKITMRNIFEPQVFEEEKKILNSIKTAYLIQEERFKPAKINKNSDMTMEEIREFCCLGKDAQTLLDEAVESLCLSNRGYLRTIKIARTIADLEPSGNIKKNHVAEALSYKGGF